MFSRAARVSQRLPTCRAGVQRQLRVRLSSTSPTTVTSTSTSSTPTSTSAPTSSTPKPSFAKPILPKERGSATRTAYIKAWRPVADLVELYSMIRGIEQKFGKVLEAHFLKDFEDPTKYQLMCFIVFADAKSVQQIPKAGIDMAVPNHTANREISEISLEEIESVMFANEIGEGSSAEEQTPANSIGFNLMRSNFDYMSEGINFTRIYQSTQVRTMEQFQNWAGFSKLKEASNPSYTIKEWDLFANADGTDQTRMRAALQLCERNVRLRPQRAESRPSVHSEKPEKPLSNTASDSIPVTPVKVPTRPAKSEQEPPKPKSEPPPIPKPEPIPEAKPKPVAKPEFEKILSEKSSTTTKKPTSPPASTPLQKAAAKMIPEKKETPPAPKLVIPPPVVKNSNAPARRKEPKPKIKAVKVAPKKLKVTITSESRSSKEEKRAPEPEKPKGALGRLWSFFDRKST